MSEIGKIAENFWYEIPNHFQFVKLDAQVILNDFNWQARFHDHIIRNNKSFKRIQNYIINNPKNWNDDKFYD